MAQNSKWFKFIPWYLTIACTISIVLLGTYLYANVEWFKKSALDNKELLTDGNYRIYVYAAHLSMIKRSLGIITGVGITFIGLGVSFYSMSQESTAEITGLGKLASSSPGILAICLGCWLIIQSISSKDSYKFDSPDSSQTEAKKP